MSEMVYLYDGSFDGFLCCIFESYAKHEVLTAIYSGEDFEPVLFATRTVLTDSEHARRVRLGIRRRSPDAILLIQRGFLTCMENREMNLYRLVVKLFHEGPKFLTNLSDDTLYPVLKAVRFLGVECEKLRGFVRFSELGGVLGSEIEPKNWVLPVLSPHFCSRYQNERFFIYDRTHHEILLYADRKAVIQSLDFFQMAPPDQQEAGYRLLWKRFYDTIAIRERKNPRCQMTNLPKRYRPMMTEFQGPEYFKARSSPADVGFPSAQDGKSALGKPAEFLPSAPESAP